MAEQSRTIRLKLPTQDLQYLTLGSDQPKRLQAWVDGLPIMNTGDTSRELFRFIQELNRIRVKTPVRMRLLEIIRPALLRVTRSLGKHYLNQSLVLPEKSRRIAGLAQALESHLADGYKLVAVRGVRRLEEKEGPELVSTAIHRALTTLSDILVRSYQLYSPVPVGLWLELHQLYLLADMHGLAHVEIRDEESGARPTSATEAYVRALLLATARPNQLRQQEISQVYEAARDWAQYVEVSEATESADLFVFDLQNDRPPTYRTHASVAPGTSRFLDSRMLIGKLADARDGHPGNLRVPPQMNDALLARLQQAWGVLTERSFRRREQQGNVELLLGLGSLYAELTDGMDATALVGSGRVRVLHSEDDDNLFLGGRARPGSGLDSAVDDGWSRAWGTSGHTMADDIQVDEIDFSRIHNALAEHQKNVPRQAIQYFDCQKVNVSPGGYCLEWSGSSPAALRTGELIGVRESDSQPWAVGVIRWVKQLAGEKARFGVELMAPQAAPCCARTVRKTGEAGDFLRALVLPALAAIGQPATLLLPSVGFAGGAAVEVAGLGGVRRVALGRKLNSTASFGQYEFTETTPVGSPAGKEEKEQGEDFDSIWNSL